MYERCSFFFPLNVIVAYWIMNCLSAHKSDSTLVAFSKFSLCTVSRTQKVCKFIETWTTESLSTEQRNVIQDGILDMCKTVSERLNVTGVWQDTYQLFAGETSIGSANMDEINLPFIQQVQAAIADALQAAA
eukprot:m.20895 g.20895  ORF g.20895 m.20895 type:complete len:132 (+) comp8979_c0_seq1:900-1295(+)